VRLAEAQVEQARKALAAAEAGVTAAEAAHAETKAGLGRAQALYDRWESEARRLTGLVQGGVIDAQSRDETQNQFRAASATRDEARARVATADAGIRKAAADRDKMTADVTAAEAKLEVARAEARRYEALLSYTKIRAPFDGVVTRRHVNTGDFLQPSGKSAGVFTVAQLNPVRIVVDVPEMDAPLVREKGPIKLAIQSLGRGELSGTVTRTSWSLEPSSRTLRVEVDQPNPEGLLRPGMYVYARIGVALPEAWALPVSAVVKQGEAHVCFRVEGGKAVRTPVQVGRSDGQHVQVLRLQKTGSTEWLEPDGTEAVAQPAASLTDGQAVQLP
jgi:RND family efflux transporter MFP subunit